MRNGYKWLKTRPFYLLWLVLYLFNTSAISQEYLVSVQHYSVPEGMSHRYVRYAIQDKRGFIWAATHDGLNRFDGFEFQQYTEKKDKLSGTSCRRLLEDRRGQLWLTYAHQPTAEGRSRGFYPLDLFDPASGKAIPFEQKFQAPFSRSDIIEIQGDGLKNIYLLLRSGQIYRYDGAAFWPMSGKTSVDTCHLAISREGMVGLLCQDSLIQMDSLGKVLYRTQLSEVCDFIQAANGRFWVGKFHPEDGPTMWSVQAGEAAKPFYFRDGDGLPLRFTWNRHYKTPIHSDLLDRWWVYSEGQLFLFAPNGQLLYDFSTDLQGYTLPQPSSIYFDRRNTAWIGTSDGLLSVTIRKNPFKNYLLSEGLVDTRGIVQDEQGRVFVVQAGKTWMLDAATGAAVNLDIPALTAAVQDVMGRLWFGDYQFKVHFYDPGSGKKKTFSYIDQRGKVPFMAAHTLYPDAVSGRIWIGTDGLGLAYVDNLDQGITLFTEYNQFQHLQDANIQSFLKDGQGIWLGTDLGLYLLEPGKGVTAEYSQRTGSLPFDDIKHVYIDQEGIFWLATNQGGLVRWNKESGRFRQFTQRNGLSNEVIHAVYEDESDQLWLPSNYGLMCFDKHSFRINTYLPRDGLPHEEFNYCSHYQASDGRLFFGGLKGVTAFYPEAFYPEIGQESPSLRISQYLELEGTTGAFVDKTAKLLVANEIRLSTRNKSFILKIAFPDYQSPKGNRFAYRIEGLYENWVYQSDNTIQVNGLPYGDYTLQAKAQGASGQWSAHELRLPLRVISPFYLQGWFLAACLALVLFLIWWRIRTLKQTALRLEAEVQKRTFKIEEDKQLIEKQAAELRELDKMKSRFFANVAHELRTPLTLILGPLKTVLSDPGLEKRFFNPLQMVQNSAKGLFRLAEEILDMDKLEAHTLDLQEEILMFYPFMRRLVSTFESHAQANGIKLQLNYQARENLYLSVDVKKLERILFNLLSNAFKFTGRGGKVSVTVQENIDCIRILVADTGRGIHPDDLPHIFDRFYQARYQGGQAEGGAGIGLALAYEYAHLLKGKLMAESQLNEGSTFVLELESSTLEEAASDETKTIPATAFAEGQETLSVISLETNGEQNQKAGAAENATEAAILLAEDNSDMRLFLQDVLAPPYRVIATSNGAHALEQLENLPADQLPELIITDIMMPEMDGFTLISRLKASLEWQGIPIVALTARVGLDDRLAALRIGVDDYLAKPFEPAELLARVANLLKNYRERREWLVTQAATVEKNAYFLKIDPLNEIIPADQQWLADLEDIALQKIGSSDFTVSELAYQLHLSERNLRRKLKALTGLSPGDYLNEIRLQRARQLLEGRIYKTVSEVSYAIGLATPRHFSRIFKSRFGKSAFELFLTETLVIPADSCPYIVRFVTLLPAYTCIVNPKDIFTSRVNFKSPFKSSEV